MKLLILVFSIFFFFFCQAQKSGIKEKEKHIMLKYDSIEYADIRLTNTSQKLKSLLSQSKMLNYNPGILKGMILLQSQATRQGDYGLSEDYDDRAEAMAFVDKDYHSISLITINRANTAIGLGLLSEAKEMIFRNKSNADKIPNKADKARYFANSYMMLSGVYSRLKKNDSVVYYTKKSLDVMETVPVRELTDLQKAKYYHLYIFQLMNMAIVYMEKNSPPDPALAEFYIKKALQFSERHPKYFNLCDIEVYETASYIYLELKQYEKSISFAKKALEAERTKRRPEERLAAYGDLKNAYKAIKNESEELRYLKLYTQLSDSINKVQKNTIINQSRNKISKSENEITKKYYEKRKKNFLIFIGIIVLITAAGWRYGVQKKRKYQKKYNQLITQLRNENVLHDKSPVKENKLSLNKNSISSETENKLLKKLDVFEKSEKFLRKDMTLNYLSSQLKTNVTYLSEIINKNKGMNFNSYINSLRIRYITYKLYNEKEYLEYKISYLAEESGFASSKVFVNAFKNEHGVTPSYFIQQLRVVSQ